MQNDWRDLTEEEEKKTKEFEEYRFQTLYGHRITDRIDLGEELIGVKIGCLLKGIYFDVKDLSKILKSRGAYDDMIVECELFNQKLRHLAQRTNVFFDPNKKC